MNFNNPIPRHTGPRFHEASRQRSPRDRDSVTQAWKKDGRQSAQLASYGNALANVQRQIAMLRRRKGSGDEPDTIRLLLCDGIAGGPPKYYLVSATLDPDQTPTP